MKRRFLIALILNLFFSMPWALGHSNIGIPIIKNYTKEVYKAGLQNWDIIQDKLGKMYFANDQGLLIFDGANWKLVQVANKTIVRSILIDGERIYVGSQGDFGYFEPNEKAILVYFSLKDKMPKEEQNFADVWRISKNKDEIIFRTVDKVFSYDGEIKVSNILPDFTFLNKKQEKVSLHYLENNLPSPKDAQFHIFSDHPPLKESIITGLIPLDNQILIATKKMGIFHFDGKKLSPWQMNDKDLIKGHRINCSIRINKEWIALGTLSGGLFIVDNAGRVIYHLDISKGLQSNAVSKIFKDGTGNIWLTLGSGIDYIEINSPFSKINPNINSEGTGYTVKIHQDKIYFGTSDGLYTNTWKSYYYPLGDQSFELVENTRGQVWNLDTYNDELLLGHHDGTFRVEDNRAVLLSSLPGSWDFIPLKGHKDLLLEGNYHGLSLYHFENGHWQFQDKIKNMINESCRILAQDNKGNIWVAHPYRGLYRIVLDVKKKQIDSIKLYNAKNGFPSNWCHVFKLGDGILFSSTKGIYSFNDETDSFEQSNMWSEVIKPNSHVQRLIEDKMGNIWFVVDNVVGVFLIKDFGIEKRLEKRVFPKLIGKLVGGFEHIYPYDEENVFFPLERGFMHFNPTKYGVSDTLFHINLQEVKLGDSTVVFGGSQTQRWIKPVFNHNQNAFIFNYSATEYSDFNLVKFQYLLEGLDREWSPWTTKNIKEYTALPSGNYSFQVRARNALGYTTKIKSFEFEIKPPWYLSNIAKAIYPLLTLLIILGLVLIPRRKFEQEKAILKQEQEKTLDETAKVYEKIVAKNEAEIQELQQEKLKAEIQFKTQELATTTMHLVQKGELLNKLKENLNLMLKNAKEPIVKKEIRTTLHLLNQNAKLDEDWEQFAQYFDEVHADFLKRLKISYPFLTPKDQRLCIYLKMNLSTKEIVPLMNISVRGVEVSRYRLRKKLNLDNSENLNEFMMRF